MKLEGRRQSKNVQKQTPSEYKHVLDDQKFIRDLIGNTNERLKDKTPISKVKPNINEQMNDINPGLAQYTGDYKINNRTLRESNKPGTLSKNNKIKDAKFFLK